MKHKHEYDAEFVVVNAAIAAFTEMGKTMPPDDFRALLAGTVATIVGTMPEKYWLKFSEIKPCGKPGCDCHLKRVPSWIALFTALRDDYKDVRSEREDQESHAE